MPFDVHSNTTKNRLYLRLDGFLTDQETKEAADQVIAHINKLRPGFDAITDISTYKPGSEKAAAEIVRAQQVYKSRGVRLIVRIVGASVLGKMQFQRTGQEVGLEMAYVTSLQEAERLLDG
jgi:hypothetical protein